MADYSRIGDIASWAIMDCNGDSDRAFAVTQMMADFVNDHPGGFEDRPMPDTYRLAVREGYGRQYGIDA